MEPTILQGLMSSFRRILCITKSGRWSCTNKPQRPADESRVGSPNIKIYLAHFHLWPETYREARLSSAHVGFSTAV